MNKTAFKLFLCCSLIAAVTAFLLLCFNGLCFGALLSDYNDSPQASAVKTLQNISASLERSDNHYRLQDDSLVPKGYWCILIAPDGNIVWSENMPEDIPDHYTINDVACFTKWFLNDYPVYVHTEDYGLLVLGLPKNSVGKYDLAYSMAWFDSLPERLVLLVAVNLLLSLALAAMIGIGLYRKLHQVWQGIDALSQEQPVHLPEKGVTAQVTRAINQCSAVLERKNAALAIRDEARQNWINGISHDIRTPLAVIMGKAEAIQSSDSIPDDCQENAAVIVAQSQRVKQLVADLNLISALEYDMQSSRREPVKICPLIRSVVTDTLNSTPVELYGLSLDLRDEKSVISADKTLMHRALFNLISNAIRHNPQGCNIEITQFEKAGTVFIRVDDNGSGVPQDVLKTISVMPKTAHGLGVPMVYRIIKAHGGTFLARNDRGFKTEIRLPAAQ